MRPLIWFRADLRVRDNPALHAAARDAGRGAVAVFVICPGQWQEHDWAAVKVDFILRTLAELRDALADLKVPLLIRQAETFDDVPGMLDELAHEHHCDALFFNREYEVNETRRDQAVTKRFMEAGRAVRSFHDQCIVPPDVLRTSNDGVYTVFTPFKKAWQAHLRDHGPPEPRSKPRRLDSMVIQADDVPGEVEGFDGDAGLPDLWPAGENAARRALRRFIDRKVAEYAKKRDLPAEDATSRLSPHLTVGAISPVACLHAAIEANHGALNGRKSGPAVWISELAWRDFYRAVMAGFPRVSMNQPFKTDTRSIDWRDDEESFEAWCEGRTGFPIVDAAMRQLAETGWMHNRLRMVSAMFLTKDLLVDWRRGERHFMRHLIDGDLASNNGGWQWSASTGTDAAPYFRIFNPTRQSERFDPEGDFIRERVQELAELDAGQVHDPPAEVRDECGYPAPIVDHASARKRAIAAFK